MEKYQSLQITPKDKNTKGVKISRREKKKRVPLDELVTPAERNDGQNPHEAIAYIIVLADIL